MTNETKELHGAESFRNRQVAQLIKKFPASYGIRRFTTVFTRAHYRLYSEPDEYSPHFPYYFLQSGLILFSICA